MLPQLAGTLCTDGRSPLHLAALNDHADVADFLLEKGAWVDAYDGDDDTALHLAARSVSATAITKPAHHTVDA